MIKKVFIAATMLATVATTGFAKNNKKVVTPATTPVVEELPTREQNISYALGVDFGKHLRELNATYNITVDTNYVVKGVLAGLGDRSKLSEGEIRAIFQDLDMLIKQRESEKYETNKEAGEMFLKLNKQNPDIHETASGLQYKIVKQGTGEKPTAQSKVKVHYHGTTIDGKVFDSSVQRGEPISFQLNQVIQGWQEGVQLMPVGSKYIFYIPSKLAYGDRGAGNVIPGGATLIFEIELLEIEK